MDSLPSNSILLKGRRLKEERSLRRELILFLDLLELYISVGYDLAFAWQETLNHLKGSAHLNLNQTGTKSWEGQGLLHHLKYLEQEFPIVRYRFAFTGLVQLYSRGGALTPFIQSFSRFLRQELERDLSAYIRDCPTRANVLMILFFLPPALALLLFPLIQAFQHFSGL